jgi:hypothetical protein
MMGMSMRCELRQVCVVSCCVCGAEAPLEEVRPERLGALLLDGGGSAEVVLPGNGWRRVNVRRGPRSKLVVLYTCSDGCRARFWTPCADGSGAKVYEPK